MNVIPEWLVLEWEILQHRCMALAYTALMLYKSSLWNGTSPHRHNTESSHPPPVRRHTQQSLCKTEIIDQNFGEGVPV